MTDKITIIVEQPTVARNMELYGGSFESNLARALAKADTTNASKIKATWPELWEKFLNWNK